MTVRRERAASFRPEYIALAVGLSLAATLLLIAAVGAFSTLLLPWLPPQTNGDNYRPFITSGVGPGLVLFTILALVALWRATRVNRTVLELWLAVSLGLLVLDSILTQVGGARGSIGWYTGRMGALISAMAVLWAYLYEVNATYARAEQIAATERSLIETNRRQSQKMEAVGHLTSGIAHDFNNLLMVQTSAFKAIQQRPGDIDRILKVTESGLLAINRGMALTARLLLFSRRTLLSREQLNPNAVLTDFAAMLVHAVPPNVRLEWQLDPALRCVSLDSIDFETAILNLVVNARDALVGAEGRILIATRNAVCSQDAVPAGSRPHELDLEAVEYAVVSITDNGPGMPQAVAARAFDPFFTTKEPGQGTGLGLSQVQGFAQSANGRAVILTGPSGTTIELWLPYAPDQILEPAGIVVADADLATAK